MDESQADIVYELVVKGFTDLGVSDPRLINRSFLLKQGLYAGQVWRCEGWQAIWLFDGSSLEFSDSTGNKVKAVPLIIEESRKAA